eukprot:10542940-Lingulodinium_polyedra.AAC.1
MGRLGEGGQMLRMPPRQRRARHPASQSCGLLRSASACGPPAAAALGEVGRAYAGAPLWAPPPPS